jgi:hypothetical protein
MTKRIYWSDIIECDDQLFENLDALIAVATQTPECFEFWTSGSDYEIVSVDTNDESELVVTYTAIDNYDDNGDEIRKTVVERLDYTIGKELAVLVGSD